MSANLVVDINATCQTSVSFATSSVGTVPASGIQIGQVVDLLTANTFCNVFGTSAPNANQVLVQVQTSDSTASGTFTDPTSGLAQLPTNMQSGGILVVGSGSQAVSGDIHFGAFQRPGRYARCIILSGLNTGWVTAGFVSQRKTTGSGGGFSYAPLTGSVNV